MIRKFISFVVAVLVFLPTLPVQEAEAGVLLRSAQVRSRVRTRTPRVRLGYQKASTWVSVSRRVNPINTRTLTSENALAKYERRLERYNREVDRIEKRREREEKRELRRKQSEERRAQAKAKREHARKLEQQKRKAELSGEAGEESGVDSSSNDSGRVTIRGQSKSATFWSRFWSSLINRKEK